MSETARSGFRNEEWVVRQFNNYPASSYAKGWLKKMGYDASRIEHLCGQTTLKMGYNNKADVLLLIENNVEWVSVKKFVASFNQIDKRWVDQYANDLDMPDLVSNTLKKFCGQEGHRPCDLLSNDELDKVASKHRFTMNEVSNDERDAVIKFLDKHKKRIARYIVSGVGKASAKWMLVVEYNKDDVPTRSAIIPIDDVVNHCIGSPTITPRGNIKYGGLTIQRKGGDGGAKTAQMLQFKFSPKEIFDLENVEIVMGASDIP